MNLNEIKALAAKIAGDVGTLNRELATYTPPVTPPPVVVTPPPVPPATPAKTLLEVTKGLTIPAGAGVDLDTMKKMFPTAAAGHGKNQGFWANESRCLQVLPSGAFRVHMNRAAWKNVPDAAVPLTRPVSAARLSYKVRFGPDGTKWHWGQSGKLFGLARHKEGWFPGGGRIGRRNFSDCPAWSTNANGSVRIGPYVYGQHRPKVTDQVWGPDYPDGTLRWGGPRIDGLFEAAGEWLFELDHTPTDNGKQSVVTWRVNGSTRWTATMDLLAPGEPHEITHCHFRCMFGGNTIDYWPPASVPVSTLEFADFRVIEL